MKRLLFALLLLPVVAAAQYRTDDFSLDISRGVTRIPVGITFDKDTVIPLNVRSEIAGLSISGIAILGNNQDSYIRVILKDDYNYEHLIYENFPLLTDSLVTAFDNTAIETVSLDHISPQSIRVELYHATLQLESLSYTTTSANRGYVNSASIQRTQCQYIANRLNENLEKRNMTWHAGVTSVSERSYEEKKAMFGGKVPQLYGFDYYKGGIFVIPESEETTSQETPQRAMTTNQYVSEWDWRNRHGKNWMTPVRNQGTTCGSCWAFAGVGTLEAYVNLYYNRLINDTLSVQELVSCANVGGCSGAPERMVFYYVKRHGIVKEECFPYDSTEVDCSLKCQNPNEIIYIDDYNPSINPPTSEQQLKAPLLIAPMAFTLSSWTHSMTIAGYKTIKYGDLIYYGNSTNPESDPITIIYPYLALLGKTAWLVKNSWGTGWGDNGYGYIVVNLANISSYSSLDGTSITSMQYSDADIICEDADGDGYYFWGAGPKPSHCPSVAPDTPDGDDSNPNYGPIDSYGNLQVLTNGITINSSVTYNSNYTASRHINIVANGTLTITGTTTMTRGARIRVYNGGTLIVDGGTINDAYIEMTSGSHLIVKNNGTVNMISNADLEAPQGAIVDVTYGSIN